MVADFKSESVAGLNRNSQRLIDSTPIPLGKLCKWAKSNGRIRGMKMHVVYDPNTDCPRILDITDANVNDAQIGRRIKIEAGVAYVIDKGYCHYGWWTAIAKAGSTFVTRPKSNMGLALVCERPVAEPQGDGFLVLKTMKCALPARAIPSSRSACAACLSSVTRATPSPC